MVEVPLVIYTPAGVRKVIGTAEIEETEDGLMVSANITDTDEQKRIFGDLTKGLSISEAEETVTNPTIVNHNVFNQDKDKNS